MILVYLKEIETQYSGSASKDNKDFTTTIKPENIDYKNNTFIWRGKFKYWYRRLGLAISMCLIYLVTGIASASFILYTVQHFNIEKITEFTFYLVVSLFLLFIAAYALIRLCCVLPPQFLIGRKLRGVNT